MSVGNLVSSRAAQYGRQFVNLSLSSYSILTMSKTSTSGGTSYPRLSRPPLREALIDVRLNGKLHESLMPSLKAFNAPGFSAVGEIKFGGVKLELAREKIASATITSDEIIGVRFENEDKSQVLQVRRDGMALSILKNYQTWDAMRDTIMPLWFKFANLAGPVKVSRLAVRYINAITVPSNDDYDNYFTAGPRIPKRLPQILNGFLQRIVIPVPTANQAIITQVLETLTQTSSTAILDIDVFGPCVLDASAPEVWSILNQLNAFATRVFFASVTDKALELFQ